MTRLQRALYMSVKCPNMIPRIQVLAILLIFSALLIYFFAYNQYAHLLAHDQPLSTFLAKGLAIVNPAKDPIEEAIKPAGFYLTEARAVKLFFLVCAFLLLSSLSLAIYHRKMAGPFILFLPICFSSAVVFASLLKVTHDIGLLNGT